MNFNTFYAQKNIFYTLKILYFKLFLVFQKRVTENLQGEAGEDAKMTEQPASILRILRECPARYAKSR